MIGTMIRASLGKNRIVSALLAGFLALSTGLLAAAVILGVGVFGSVQGFMESARTPHLMQMHAGPVDLPRIEAFAAQRPEVEAVEVIETLMVDNAALSFAGQSLDAEIQQTSLVRQPTHMDLLFAEDGTLVDAAVGEVWVPFFYADAYGVAPGDSVRFDLPGGSTELTVAGAFRDSQMNSTLSSSKRLLVSDADYATLHDLGGLTPEYLISFRLHDPAHAATVEAAYHEAGLEAGGPALSWSMFLVVNSINDGITVLLFSAMAMVILLIAMLSIRYTLHTTVVEDLPEIGTMKALGVPDRRIRQIYLGKYKVLLGLGTMLGLLAALLARDPILAGVRRHLGQVNAPALGVLAGLAAGVLLYLIALGYVRHVLGRLREIPALQALRGSIDKDGRRRPRPLLGRASGGTVIPRLAVARLRREPGQHLTIAAVAFLVTVVMLVPLRFLTTMSDARFVDYMGMGSYDLRIDLLNRPDAAALAEEIATTLAADTRVASVVVHTLEAETAITPNGTAPLRVDYGDQTTFPLRYAHGGAPSTASEIGLSQLNADRLEVGIGGSVTLRSANAPAGTATFTVSGIYQDITNGGQTAKALPGPTRDAPAPSMMIAAATDTPAAVAASLAAAHPDATVIETATYAQRILKSLIDVMRILAGVFGAVGVLIAALIAGISIRLMLVTERRDLAVLGALGFTGGRLRLQYLLRILAMVAVGVLLAVALSAPLGNLLADLVFGTVGLSGITLALNPLATALASAAVLASAWCITALHTRPGFNADLATRLRH